MEMENAREEREVVRPIIYFYLVISFTVSCLYVFTTLSCYYQTFLTDWIRVHSVVVGIYITLTIFFTITTIYVEAHLRRRTEYFHDSGPKLLSWVVCLPVFLGLLLAMLAPVIITQGAKAAFRPMSGWEYLILVTGTLALTIILMLFIFVVATRKEFNARIRFCDNVEEMTQKAVADGTAVVTTLTTE